MYTYEGDILCTSSVKHFHSGKRIIQKISVDVRDLSQTVRRLLVGNRI